MPTKKNPTPAATQATLPPARVRGAARLRPLGAPPIALEPVAAAAATATDVEVAPAAKPKRPKLVRDSFTIPKTEYGDLQDLKQRALKLGHHAKKSELLRAGIKTLSAMTDEAFLASLAEVPAMKTGRPAKG